MPTQNSSENSNKNSGCLGGCVVLVGVAAVAATLAQWLDSQWPVWVGIPVNIVLIMWVVGRGKAADKGGGN
jgi:hypothetical protein